MFDVLCSLAALGEFFAEAKTVKMAAEQYNRDLPCEEKKESKPFVYKDAYPNRSRIARKCNNHWADTSKPYENTKEEEKTPLEKWLNDHIDLLIKIMSADGEFLIKNEELKEVDKDELSTLLFEKADNVESIINTEDGLLIKTKGGGVM